MQTAIFDLESNGLLDTLCCIHSLVVNKESTVLSCTDNSTLYPSIDKGISTLLSSDRVVGHNIIAFDIPAIEKVIGESTASILMDKAVDTLVLSRLIYPEIINQDMTVWRSKLPKDLWGQHSLKAWGYRLGVYKGSFGETSDWSSWSESMQSYCEQDVVVTSKLLEHLEGRNPDARAVWLEMEVQKIMTIQERNGAPFDVAKASSLAAEIKEITDDIKMELQETMPPNITKKHFVPKRDNKKEGYKAGCALTKIKFSAFNPNSRQQIISYLQKHGWNPSSYTDKGNPQVSTEEVKALGSKYPTIKRLGQFLEANKLLSQLATGDKAWLKYVKNGKIHGRVITNGAMTGRATHSQPNLAQVPSPRAFKGKECRELFYAPDGYKIVGADASGLELRMLAHYLYPWDNGAYAKVILEGDIHTHNQESAGLATRDLAKTFIYATLYGAGPLKIGAMLEPEANELRQKALGKAAINKFCAAVPAYTKLKNRVVNTYRTRGYLRGLDGRILKPRGEHSALNTLLQSAGAVVCKWWVVKTWELLHDKGLSDKASPLLWIHDEQQLLVRSEYTEEIGRVMEEAIVQTGMELKINMPLAGEYAVGNSWYDTH